MLFYVMYDLLIQSTFYPIMIGLYLYARITNNLDLIRHIFFFRGYINKMENLCLQHDCGDVDTFTFDYLKFFIAIHIPSIVQVACKTYVGVRAAFYENYKRKSVERYYTYTFIFYCYNTLHNTIMFIFMADYYGVYVFPIISSIVLFAAVSIYALYRFTLFKDKGFLRHEQLWCGDVVASSDEEEANKNCRNGEIYYKCTQESDNCIIFFKRPAPKHMRKKSILDQLKNAIRNQKQERKRKKKDQLQFNVDLYDQEYNSEVRHRGYTEYNQRKRINFEKHNSIDLASPVKGLYTGSNKIFNSQDYDFRNV